MRKMVITKSTENEMKRGIRGTKTAKTKDLGTLCMEVLVAVIGSMGILAAVAFVTGERITEWNGVWTGIVFVILSLVIWVALTIGGRKTSVRDKKTKNYCVTTNIMV